MKHVAAGSAACSGREQSTPACIMELFLSPRRTALTQEETFVFCWHSAPVQAHCYTTCLRQADGGTVSPHIHTSSCECTHTETPCSTLSASL